MKKNFVLILTIFLAGMLFTGCSKGENEISINTTIKAFSTVEQRQEYADTLDTTKYQIIGEQFSRHYNMRSTYDLVLIEKANNENYEVFQFSSKDTRKEFREKLDNNTKVSYYALNGFYYLIIVNENIIEKSTITVKEILQNDENYIVIANDDSLVMIPKNISEFITSYEGNILNLEREAGILTKATFLITEELQNKIQ